MPTLETLVKYSKEELYSYDQAKEIIGVEWDAITRAVSAGVLTSVRLPHEKNKFLIKYEVEALRGFKQATSRKARKLAEEARAVHNLNTHPQAELGRELVTQEMNSSASTDKPLSEYLDLCIRRNPRTVRELLDYVRDLTGDTRHSFMAGVK